MANKIITLEELENSKIFVKEGSMIQYPSPNELLDNFRQSLGNLYTESNVTVKGSNIVNNQNEDDTLNTAYGRYLVEFKLPPAFDCFNSFSTIGMIVALDTQKPVIKIYNGKRVSACMNLTIFNADNVFTQELTNTSKNSWSKVKTYIEKINDDIKEYEMTCKMLAEKVLREDEINIQIGKLVQYGIKNQKLGITPITDAVKSLIDPKSKYAIKNGETTAWNMLNAVTDYISTKADLSDESTKSQIIGEFFAVESNLSFS